MYCQASLLFFNTQPDHQARNPCMHLSQVPAAASTADQHMPQAFSAKLTNRLRKAGSADHSTQSNNHTMQNITAASAVLRIATRQQSPK
jgi:hypothetical protein